MVNEDIDNFHFVLHLWRVPGVAPGVSGVSLGLLVGCLGRRWTVPTGSWWASWDLWESMGIFGRFLECPCVVTGNPWVSG